MNHKRLTIGVRKVSTLILGITLVLAQISCGGGSTEGPDPEPIDIVREDHHPFLIVKKEQFQSFRDKADTEPWKSMKADALERAVKHVGNDAYDLQYYIGAAALAYILDEANAEDYAMRVRDAIVNQYSKLELSDGSGWGTVVPPMGSFFSAILALDIVYDALSLEDIAACEKVIEEQIFKVGRTGSWVDIRYGTQGAWDIYKGDRTTPDDGYYNSIMYQVTEDGVSPVTNHYAWERVGGGNSRVSKSGYMDVLEFTGIDNRYYSNERLQKFQRWLFGSSVNCNKEMAIFGDMLPDQGISNDMLHRRVVNFDMEAAGYAAWFHEGRPAIGNMLTYLVPKTALPAPVVPSSKLYENGGAFFREKEDDSKGLQAVLYNIKAQDEWHTHNEVNGLALSGMGNRLLVNGGRLGEPTRAAALNNTLTINGENHRSRLGGGIVEGFTTDELDYSSGYSGPSLVGSKHYRNLFLMHGTDEANAYFVLIDEVEASAGDQINNFIHPANQSDVTTVENGQEYETAINHYETIGGSKLSLFYATPTKAVNIEKVSGAVPDRYPGYPDHNRLESVYDVNAEGKVNLVTLLFPSDINISKPSSGRITGEGISGGIVDHGGNVTDVIIESFNDQAYTHGNITFKGKAVISRSTGDANSFYFIRHGSQFDQGGIGFESDVDISIYTKGNQGVISSSGTTIKLKRAGIQNVQFDVSVTTVDSGDGFIEVTIPEGEVRFN
ncbi:MAG: hypothetical protein JXQ96_22565 [Cyclobacteriaceae bacterium]